ncbi:hypothetical protein M426DRAFT_320201 [Hypoxylon sp. CI-4A]|nr:hypothetical protein M426DRAFT_320201 [Hypoxylon sp. CI-4A]
MEQTKALNALEPYLALTKSATSPRAAADLVTHATSNPNTYVFAELLQTPQIQALSQSSDYASYLTLLEIFSYGTFDAYSLAVNNGTNNLPKLNDAQALKLRQLSLLSLARDPHNLSYASLQRDLQLPDARAVEDLVISVIYAGLIEAQLDPRYQAVHVSGVSPLRDLAPNSVPSLLTALRSWSDRCADTLTELEVQVAAVKAAARERYTESQEWELKQAQEVEALKLAESGGGNGGVGGGGNSGVHSRGQGQFLNSAIARLRAGGAAATAAANQRNGKRGSGSLEQGQDDDEAMDLDEEEPDDADFSGGGSNNNNSNSGVGASGKKQRASRRKL